MKRNEIPKSISKKISTIRKTKRQTKSQAGCFISVSIHCYGVTLEKSLYVWFHLDNLDHRLFVTGSVFTW